MDFKNLEKYYNNDIFCYGKELTSLIGSPKIVLCSFNCGNNKLK